MLTVAADVILCNFYCFPDTLESKLYSGGGLLTVRGRGQRTCTKTGRTGRRKAENSANSQTVSVTCTAITKLNLSEATEWKQVFLKLENVGSMLDATV